MRSLLVALAVASGAWAQTISNNTLALRACQAPHASYPFCNTTLPTATRAAAVFPYLEQGDYGPLLSARGYPRGNVYNLTSRLGACGRGGRRG
jgi:hypothetical protein